MSEYPPTPEQQVAIEIAESGKTMKLLAFAGAGKTSTLVFVAKALGKLGKKGLYLAFNKDIATEANSKMPKNVRAKTFHSMALSQMPAYKKRLEKEFPFAEFVRRFKIEPLGFYVKNGEDHGFFDKNKMIVLSEAAQKNLIDRTLVKFYTDPEDGVDAPKEEHMLAAIEEPDFQWVVSPEDAKAICNELMPVVRDLWADFSNPEGEIGLAGRHDVYLKMWAMSKPQLDTDFILFDEAQDADPIMTTVLTSQKCQVIYVGDPYQQIYSFRGALNVMQMLDAPQAELTQSFRFGHELAMQCQPILNALGCKSEIRGLLDKPTKVFKRTPETEEEIKSIQAILCRTNTEAVSLTIESVKKMRERGGSEHDLILPLNISFKETKEMMFAIAKLCKAPCDHPKLVGFRNFKELKKYADDCPKDTDISPFVRMFCTVGMEKVMDTINMVENIDPATHKGPVVTTAHRSKGLEWDNCLLAEDMAAVWEEADVNDPETLSDDELRLLYVAITRAKKNIWLGEVSWFLDELERVYK